MADHEARRVLDALEAYLGEVDSERIVRKAFLAGVRVGRRVALSTLSTGASRARERALHPSSPLVDPLTNPSPLGLDSSPDPLVDPKSTARANFGAPETLELFAPPRAPLAAVRKRRSTVPDELALSPGMRAFAEAGGLDAVHELAAMKDHFRATGEPRADWPATFREWCRHSLEFRARARR